MPSHLRRCQPADLVSCPAARSARLGPFAAERPTGCLLVEVADARAAAGVICDEVLRWLSGVGYDVRQELQVQGAPLTLTPTRARDPEPVTPARDPSPYPAGRAKTCAPRQEANPLRTPAYFRKTAAPLCSTHTHLRMNERTR